MGKCRNSEMYFTFLILVGVSSILWRWWSKAPVVRDARVNLYNQLQ